MDRGDLSSYPCKNSLRRLLDRGDLSSYISFVLLAMSCQVEVDGGQDHRSKTQVGLKEGLGQDAADARR
jgi:hypothetical protein